VLAAVAAASFIYDVTAGIALLFAPSVLPQWFAMALPEPPLFLQLNGLFLIAVGAGYVLPYRDPRRYRGYLWVFGVGLKAAGAALFLATHVQQNGPAALLLFAAGDAVMAALSLAALLLPDTASAR
jgi:hypothetical protein